MKGEEIIKHLNRWGEWGWLGIAFEHLPLPSRRSEVWFGGRKHLYLWNETSGVFKEGRSVQEDRMMLRYYSVVERSVGEANRVVVVQIVVM